MDEYVWVELRRMEGPRKDGVGKQEQGRGLDEDRSTDAWPGDSGENTLCSVFIPGGLGLQEFESVHNMNL